MEVVFSEPVEETSAETVANYAIDQGVSISSATLQADNRTVFLAASTLSQGVTYTLTVSGVTDRAKTPNLIANTQQTFEYVAEQSLSFQQGVGDYAGTVDTNLLEYYPDVEYAAAASLTVDADEPAGAGNKAAQALMRFENIFGSGPDQVPPGAQVVSAELQLQVLDPGSSFDLHRVLQSWADTDTWNTLDSGIQADDSEAAATADASTGAMGAGTLPIDVTISLTLWAAIPSTNHGWALLPTGTDGADFYSAEGATPPTLSVTFLPPVPNDPPEALDDTASTATEDTAETIDVLANDSDPDEGDVLTVLSVTQGTNGSVVNNGTDVTYTPDLDFNGLDSFTYTVTDDGTAGGPAQTSAAAAVSITVNPHVESFYAIDEATAIGTVAGSRLDTEASDNIREELTEELVGKLSILEHVWTFSLAGGSSITFHVEAHHTDAEDTPQTYELPGELSGSVLVRVLDTSRRPKSTLDTLYVDEMFIRCE